MTPNISRGEALERLAAEYAASDQMFEKPLGQWRLALRRFRGRRSGMVGLSLIIGLILIAVFAPLIAPYEPNEDLIGEQDVRRYQAPCIYVLGCPDDQPQHWMGIDGNVRDYYSRIIFGSRVSLQLGFFTVTLALVVGSAIGAVAGYLGGWFDNIVMRFMDVILGFPSLLMAIASNKSPAR